jgi:hypothetical protein
MAGEGGSTTLLTVAIGRAGRAIRLRLLLTSPRLRGEARGGAQRSVRVRGTIREPEPVESPPSPARKLLATSPCKRGDVKNGHDIAAAFGKYEQLALCFCGTDDEFPLLYSVTSFGGTA